MDAFGKKVKVDMKRLYYFDPASPAREVKLYEKKSQVICHQDSEKGIKRIRIIKGKHIGDRSGLVKVRPTKRIFTDRFADYFIIKDDQIKTIVELK